MHLQKMFCPIVCNISVVFESESGDPSKKLNPEHLEYDYERLNFFFWKAEVDKKILC